MDVPFNDLSRYLETKKDKILSATQRVVESGYLVNGENVKGFEREFAQFLDVQSIVGVANGTDALEIALRAADVTPGNSIILAANAGMYATSAIRQIGAVPKFVDISPESLSLDVLDLEVLLKKSDVKFKALIVTHLYGLANPHIREISNLCEKYGITLIEDCAQAHGAKVQGKHVGTFGRFATFSFYPTKNLGALGDGGAVVAMKPDDEIRIRRFAQYGWGRKYDVVQNFGRNSRLDELQAAYLRIFLNDLEQRNAARLRVASRYKAEITNPKIQLPDWKAPNYVGHLFVVRVNKEHRSNFVEYLKLNGIGVDIHYPILDPEQPILRGHEYEIPPVSAEVNPQIVSLPTFPELTEEEVSQVIGVCNEW